MNDLLKIAITQGDINGIGYEIILKAFADKFLRSACVPIVYGSPKVLAYYKKVLDLEGVKHNSINTPSEAIPNELNIISCNEDAVKVDLGKPTKEGGIAAFEALEKAVEDVKSGEVDALVTCPINKDTMQSDNFKFPGHTEYLAQRCGKDDALMLMVQDDLRVGVVTGHIPLKNVAAKITKDLLMKKIEALHEALCYNYGCVKPKIALLGLNPHSGDNGLLGVEEKELIQPVLDQAKQKGIIAMGPYPADGFFGSLSYQKFDGILAMYHDQGLIPFKTLAMGGGVNATLGLPIVRTSPAHGTAYEIVGTGVASPKSLKESIYEAIDICKERRYQDEMKKNALPIKNRNERSRKKYLQID